MFRRENHYNRYYFQDYSENYWETNYRYLGGKYEAEINEEDEDSEINERDLREESELIGELNQIIQAANPKASASLISPQIMPMPLFFECRRAFILTLGNAKNLNLGSLENVISKLANNQLTVSKNTADLNGKRLKKIENYGAS